MAKPKKPQVSATPTGDTREALRQRLLVERAWWFDAYRGTKEELIESGFAAGGMFPGDPGHGSTQSTEKGPPEVQITRTGKQRFRLRVRLDDEECGLRHEREEAQCAVERARKEEQEKLNSLPRSEDHFRRIMRLLGQPLASPEMMLAARGGYRFPKSAVEQFVQAVAEAIGELVDGPILFDQDARLREIGVIKQKTARADPAYQAQLASIAAGVHSVAAE